ncbi:MAG TPA: TIGR01212 family radical SAM protein [Bdellovibrionales bacterium]|nr:TIGR01212 family radical SAM protein [Bdellovibrionales bacterium]
MSQAQTLPYSAIGAYYKARFGGRVQKLPVTVATDCPNRAGLKGMQTCVFCDEWGSSAYPEQRSQELKRQLLDTVKQRGARYGATGYLAYFQAYTSTFLGLNRLRESFDTALGIENVHGLIVGTRPDCLSKALLDFWNEYAAKTYVSVELGVQSFNDAHLEFMRRGHDSQASVRAIELIRRACPEVDLGVHLIFGSPGETDHDAVEAARTLNRLGVGHVKLHNLHVLKGTPLAEQYAHGEFAPIELDAYTERVIAFLRHLSPEIRVHRLAAVSSRWDELVAPEWTRYKMKISQYIIDEMKRRGAVQGQLA